MFELDPIEMRLHGRGGQGTVTLAALIADAAHRSGWHVLAFPTFGTERTGAPVAAFVRISRRPVLDRSQIKRPSVLLVQDPTLVGAVDLLDGVSPEAITVINAGAVPDGFPPRTYAVPMTGLAREHLNKPVTSTAMLGACAAATGLVTIDAVCEAIHARFSGSLGDANEALARAAFDVVRMEVAA
jgi:pyruvate ferredoxin oxidoreductase gamma subunit